MKALFKLTLFVLFFISSASSQSKEKLLNKIAVLPLEYSDVDPELGAELTKLLYDELQSIPEITVFTAQMTQSIMSELDPLNCTTDGCVKDAGMRLGADMVLSGSISKSPDKAYLLSITISDMGKESIVFAKKYKCPCSLTTLLTTLPGRVISDARDVLLPLPQEIQPLAEPNNTETSAPELRENDTYSDSITGIVEKPAIGISARFALGTLNSNESPWGIELLNVLPTTKSSHLRLRFAIPASRSSQTSKDSDVSNHDLMYAVEHEWGWRGVGVVFGASYMYMMPFTKESADNSVYNYEFAHAYNWVLGIRAGRPHRGFRFRISYPIPFITEYESNMENVFVEYNAFGMFGNDRFKAGMGVQGYYKNRESSPNNYGETHFSEEFFVMAPSGRVSFLIGNKNVVSLGLDLTGLLIPDPDDSFGWSPNVVFSYLYSIAPLKNPELFDGRF